MRRFDKWRFELRKLSTIYPIEADKFASIMAHLESMGWKPYARYGGIDAGIDYDCIRLKRRGAKLKCEWDNWNEWSIEGPKATIQEIAEQLKLTAKSESRWATWRQSPNTP
jgi:hypothetical protein